MRLDADITNAEFASRRTAVCCTAAIAIAAIMAIQRANPGVTDVTWLLTIAERMLDGDRLYVDVLEANPPASVWLYIPAVLVARWAGLRPEDVVLAGTVGLLLLSLIYSGRLLWRGQLLVNPVLPVTAAFVSLGVLPGNSFAQREHLALLALLPILCLAACKAHRAPSIHTCHAVAAGLLAGAAICIKPHFLAAILLPQMYVSARLRSVRPMLASENWIAGGVFVLYVGSTFLFYREFWFDILPIIIESYLPAKVPFRYLLSTKLALIALAGMYLFLARDRLSLPLISVPLLSAAGFFLAYLVQGKGWQYHYFPAVALLTFVGVNDLERILRQTSRLRTVGATAVLGALLAWSAAKFLPYRQASASIEHEITSRSKHPSVIIISGDLGIGHPLTRRVDGRWVGSVASQWMTETSQMVLDTRSGLSEEQRRKLEHIIALDRTILAQDIQRRRPEFLILDVRPPSRLFRRNWKGWVNADPELRSLLSAYELTAGNGLVELYARRDLVPERVMVRPASPS